MKKEQPGYISWPKAFAILQRKFAATKDEVAMWIWNYPRDPRKGEPAKKSDIPELNGIRAYTYIACESHESREDNAQYRFSFDAFQLSDPCDISEHLCGLWFSEREIRAFKANDRYLTYGQVATLWGRYQISNLSSFLRAQVQAGNLLDMHPVFGATQLSNPDSTHCPAAVEAIFPREDIQLIESKQLKGIALKLKGEVTNEALCINQAKDIQLSNPGMTQRAIAAKMYRLDRQKDDGDNSKLGLSEESFRRYIKKMGNS